MKGKKTKIKTDPPPSPPQKKSFHVIRPYLRDYKTRREWRIQLTMRINFISFEDSKETGTVYTKSHNTQKL